MYLESLYKKTREKKVRVILIGGGEYGKSFIFQSTKLPGLEVIAVCDHDIDKAIEALTHSGLPRQNIGICNSPASAEQTRNSGKIIVTTDALTLMELPFDVVIEATGSPEGGARHAAAAIAQGKHVVMVSKEADSVIGPLLSRKAREAGLVYTPVDGDQPSLLMQLVMWARVIGLEVLCAGKSSEYDFIYHRKEEQISSLDRLTLAPGFNSLWDLGSRNPVKIADERANALREIPQHVVPDLIEMSIVANSLGLGVDTPRFHAPIARIGEIADFLVPREMGGLLSRPGVVDVVNLLREPDDVSMAGGVFIVVACEDKATWQVLQAKGHIVNRARSAALIYRPSHLLGVESATTVFSAALEQRSSGPAQILPNLGVVGRTTKALPAGTRLQAVGHHHLIDGVEGMVLPCCAANNSNPIPYYLLSSRLLVEDVPPGTFITGKMIEQPRDSLLWNLRAEMDATFGLS